MHCACQHHEMDSAVIAEHKATLEPRQTIRVSRYHHRFPYFSRGSLIYYFHSQKTGIRSIDDYFLDRIAPHFLRTLHSVTALRALTIYP